MIAATATTTIHKRLKSCKEMEEKKTRKTFEKMYV